MEELFTLEPISDVHGDCTVTYKVKLNRSCTLQEFIDYAITIDRCVTVSINEGSMYNKRDCIEYSNEKLVFDYMNKDDFDHNVIEGIANGGWGMMDYEVKIS